MRKIKKILGLLIYNGFAKYLPTSHTIPKIGQQRLRALCGKLILTKCGKNVNIERNATFSSKVELGDNSGIGIRATISGKCIVGNNVMMGPDCVIYSRNHEFSNLDIPMREQGYKEEKTVVIGDDVWIGGRVIILPGVHIGNHCIIGAGSVVTKDIPDWAIAAGNPAKVIKFRNEAKE